MDRVDQATQQAVQHIRYLSADIGGRGSCTPAEREAAAYVAREMAALGVEEVRLETFRASPSTYRPYALAFAAALYGTVFAWADTERWALTVAAALNLLGVWAMLAESDFAPSWPRWLLPRANSQNVVGHTPPSQPVRNHVVLCAHLDTHRTPIMYSSRAWHAAFTVLVGGAFASMLLAALAYGAGAALGWAGARWIGLAAAPMQLFALAICLHADFTPFSPGANDNASGVGVVLGLAGRLREEPLRHTAVWLALTGCEEVGAYGMAAFLDQHAADLGPDAVYVILDQVGQGQLIVLTADGMIRKRATHPGALELARRAQAALPHLPVRERIGIAYTDAAVATKRGLVALTIGALPAPGTQEGTHWHQMSDLPEHVDRDSLAQAHAFTWQVLQELDRNLGASS